MENDGVSSGSRRSGSALRCDRSSSSIQGFLTAKVVNERDGAASKCKCGAYAILYLSKTSNNPNRLFFGYLFFKIQYAQGNFFLWLDRHVAIFGKNEGPPVNAGEDEDDVNIHFAKLNVDNRLANLEDRVAAIEKKKTMNMFLIGIGVVFFLCMYVSRV
ncbi:hypothetical protein PIB30_060802 [Stylosanthes scabra]|uniref:Uncharacterized protein n=1 Tax=Stylosanthes scabra TaxID=79078 RepID=A0ABU6XII6_9FABA|nr:hypothetical protein [Stylosanthes scabra]